MLNAFDFIRELSVSAVCLRLVLAVLCGGIVGLEREYKRRPAGLRTHILICIGAAMTTLTSQYLLATGAATDPTRLGAQVVAGVGFIGAGTIILTRRNRIKGLTTAAGLWVCAIIGLACGAGYVECALYATAIILTAELLLSRLEYKIVNRAAEMNLYVEYSKTAILNDILLYLNEHHIHVMHMEAGKAVQDGVPLNTAILALRFPRTGRKQDSIAADLAAIEGVLTTQEL